MARARYRGDHQEPSFSFRITGGGERVEPFGVYDGARSRRIEIIALPQGVWREINPFAAIYLAAVRRRHGPWFDIRFSSPAEYREVQRRAPWIRKATDAARLCDPEITRGLYDMCLNHYEIVP